MTRDQEQFLAQAGRVAKLADMAFWLRALYLKSEQDEYLDTGEVLLQIAWLKDEETERALIDLEALAQLVEEGGK